MDFNTDPGVLQQELLQALQNDIECKLFLEFLKDSHSGENLSFWMKVEKYRAVALGNSDSKEDAFKFAQAILQRYFDESSDYEINITAKEKMELTSKFQAQTSPDGKFTVDPTIFDPIQSNIFALMAQDSYPKFQVSKLYKEYKKVYLEEEEKQKNSSINSRSRSKIKQAYASLTRKTSKKCRKRIEGNKREGRTKCHFEKSSFRSINSL